MKRPGKHGLPYSIFRHFEASILAPGGISSTHVHKNLRVTVLFWLLGGLSEAEEIKHRELFDSAFITTMELNKAVGRIGMPVSPGHTITVKMLRRAPQVTSICHN